ncbi:hypothetical protein FACS189450_06040 [Spirochaetia bacterium]|nr:hypothetical protein FACS189450_06040 [Spirochaetia bacterium]
MKKLDLVRLLEEAGFQLARTEGHEIYKKKGARSVSVPHHTEINEYTAATILKDAGLKKANAKKFPGKKTGKKEQERD